LTVVYCGELTIGGALPGANGVTVAAIAGINGALPDLLSRIASLQAFAPTDVNLGAQLQLAGSIVGNIQTSIQLGIAPPSIAAQIAAIAALVAAMLTQLAGVQAQLDLVLEFQGLLAAAGIHIYAFSGTSGGLGGELATELASGTPGGSPSDPANAVVLVTTSPAAWAALSQVVKVSP
jgi:hypothetical protein